MSCSSSSNIKAQIIAPVVNVTGAGTRITFAINEGNSGYTVGSGLTAGSVVRYDAPSYSYVNSSAKKPETAEVIGIIESVVVSSGITTYNIISNGLIKYPNIDTIPDLYSPTDSCNAITSLGGGAGGKDIFFLSDGCTGSLQCLEPITPGSIVKPVMQRIKNGDYNGMVLNYIGYEVGQEAQAVFPINGLLGSVTYILPATPVPNGYIEITTQKLVKVSDYQELYEVFERNFGNYVDRVYVTDSTNINNAWGSGIQAFQSTEASQIGINAGNVESASKAGGYIDIIRENSQPETDDTVPLQVGNYSFNVSSHETYKFTVPAAPPSIFTFLSSPSPSLNNFDMIPILKAKNNLSYVSIMDNLKLTGLSLGQYSNVEATLKKICDDCACCT